LKEIRERRRAKEAASGAAREELIGTREVIQEEKSAPPLQEALRAADEGIAIGAKTLVTLKAQSEQLGKIQDTLAETEDTLNRSKRIVKGISSLKGAFVNLFARKPVDTASSVATARDAKTQQLRIKSRDAEAMISSTYVEKSDAVSAEETQIDEILGKVKIMGTMASVMGSELDYQADLLENIEQRVDSTTDKTKILNRDMRRIMS